MTREKSYFGIGLLVGAVIAALFLLYFAPRYTTVKSGDTLIRQDRWSGISWRFVDNQWKRIVYLDRDWNLIDRTLREALSIPTGGVERGTALHLLRKKYPALADINDDDLLERIKIVYSKAILCDLYLTKFMATEKKGGKREAQGADTQGNR